MKRNVPVCASCFPRGSAEPEGVLGGALALDFVRRTAVTVVMEE